MARITRPVFGRAALFSTFAVLLAGGAVASPARAQDAAVQERGDIEGDGDLDNFDIQPFEQLVTKESPAPAAGDAPAPLKADSVEALRVVADDLNSGMGSGREVTLRTEYPNGSETGVQEETYSSGYIPTKDGAYEQRSVCHTNYYLAGQQVRGRTEEAISVLQLDGDRVVTTALYSQGGGAQSTYGPYDVMLLGNGFSFRNTRGLAPAYFAASEFYRARDGSVASVRRYSTGEAPNQWREVSRKAGEPPAPPADAAVERAP